MSTRPPLSWPRRAGPARSRTGSSPARPPSPPWRAVARGSSAALVPPRARSSTARQPRPCRRTAGWSILAPGRWRWIRLLDTHNTHARARAQRDSRLKEGSREPSRHMPRARVHRPSIHRLRTPRACPAPPLPRVWGQTHPTARRDVPRGPPHSAAAERVFGTCAKLTRLETSSVCYPPRRPRTRSRAMPGVAAPLLGHA